MAEPPNSKTVAALTHDDAKRKSIPTAERPGSKFLDDLQ